ncbi:NAD(P)-binding protein [Linderina pennispora]|uniref:NAD(P)-binding protein n=1 Tax=Linderina pennispora TaxID=61395 RepID=A0A1Y1WBT4_9FUNG|nr:NAD(P)-binding protein [Linderina pennispora]ORX70987.1 NAD(P)-binding protein [Linderina pennispora]
MASGFFGSKVYAVVGASADPSKFGNRVLRWYIDHNLPVIPINPKATEIEGIKCAKSLSDMDIDHSSVSVSVITPPRITESILKEASELGIKNLWLQPGSEPAGYDQLAKELNVDAIGGGACILVEGPDMVAAARSSKL